MPSLKEMLATAKATPTKALNACHNEGCANAACRNPQSLVLAAAAGLDTTDTLVVTGVGATVRYYLGTAAAARAEQQGTEVRPYVMCLPCLTALMKVAKVTERAADHDTVVEMLEAAESRATSERRESVNRRVQWRNVPENI